MGVGQIQFGGLASGLDTGSIIQALLSLERRPIQILEGRKQTEEGKLELFSTFEKLVRELRTKAQELGAGNTFYANKLTVADESVASITTSPGAQTGSHELTSVQLARADRFTFDGVVDADDETLFGAGQISFEHRGETYTIDIDDTMSLNDISDAINSHSGLDSQGEPINAGDVVTANVVNVGTEDNPSYQLVIAGDDTGLDFTLTNLTVDAGIGLTGQTQLTTAQNAIATIDGLTVERSENLFTGVIPGVTFTLTSEAQTTTFTVDVDPEGIKENIQGFVDAYNGVIDFIESQNKITIEEGDDARSTADSDIFGDPALLSVRGALDRAFLDRTAETPLGLVGIERGVDGKLTIDATEFDDALAADLEAVAELFLEERVVDDVTGEVTDPGGILARIDAELSDLIEEVPALDLNGDPILGPDGIAIVSDGLFDRRRDTINALIRSMDDQIDNLERRLEKTEESLVLRFSNLEQLLSGLQSQQAYLSSILG